MFLIDCLPGPTWIEACKSIACLPTGVASITSFIYNAIRVVTPLILIIIGMFDMAKAMTAGKEDEIKKSQQLLVKKAIAAAIIFLLFSLVTWFLDILDSNGTATQSVVSCLNVLFGQEEDEVAKTPQVIVDQQSVEYQCQSLGYTGAIRINGYAFYENRSGHTEGYKYVDLSVMFEQSTNYFSACYKNITTDVCGNYGISGKNYNLGNHGEYCVVENNSKNYVFSKNGYIDVKNDNGNYVISADTGIKNVISDELFNLNCVPERYRHKEDAFGEYKTRSAMDKLYTSMQECSACCEYFSLGQPIFDYSKDTYFGCSCAH